MKHPPLLKNKILSLHYKLVISAYIMHRIAFPFVIWHALCVINAGTAWLTVSQPVKVVQKCVYFTKISGSAIQLLKAADWQTFIGL